VFSCYLHFPFRCYKRANSVLVIQNLDFGFLKLLIIFLSRFLVGLQERMVLVLIYFEVRFLRAGFNNTIHLS